MLLARDALAQSDIVDDGLAVPEKLAVVTLARGEKLGVTDSVSVGVADLLAHDALAEGEGDDDTLGTPEALGVCSKLAVVDKLGAAVSVSVSVLDALGMLEALGDGDELSHADRLGVVTSVIDNVLDALGMPAALGDGDELSHAERLGDDDSVSDSVLALWTPEALVDGDGVDEDEEPGVSAAVDEDDWRVDSLDGVPVVDALTELVAISDIEKLCSKVTRRLATSSSQRRAAPPILTSY